MPDPETLDLAVDCVELRAQLAEVQDQCVELALDAGELHARIEALQDELAQVRAYQDARRRSALCSPAAAAG